MSQITPEWNSSVEPREIQPGLELVTYRPADLPNQELSFTTPLIDVMGRWTPGGGSDRTLPVSWERERATLKMSAGTWAPVCALVSGHDFNRGCVSVNVLDEEVQIFCGVLEDRGVMRWRIRIGGDSKRNVSVRVASKAGLDGLKLDFLDRFELVWDGQPSLEDGRDIDRLGPAVCRLVEELAIALNSVRPDFPVEFRQRYIGPIPRRAGRMLRAMDCPCDPTENRRRIVDIRLLAGDEVPHGDMMFWHPDESDESVARLLIASLCAVPQISIRLAELSDSHKCVLKFWMEFWMQHRDTLLNGNFHPRGHLENWTHLTCSDSSCRVDLLYSPRVCEGAKTSCSQILINGSHANYLILDKPAGSGMATLLNCRGEKTEELAISGSEPCCRLPVPPGGLANIQWKSNA